MTNIVDARPAYPLFRPVVQISIQSTSSATGRVDDEDRTKPLSTLNSCLCSKKKNELQAIMFRFGNHCRRFSQLGHGNSPTVAIEGTGRGLAVMTEVLEIVENEIKRIVLHGFRARDAVGLGKAEIMFGKQVN